MVSRQSMTNVFNSECFGKVPSKLIKVLDELDHDFGTTLIFKPDLSIIGKNEVDYHAYPFRLMNSLFENDSLYNKVKVDFKLNGQSIAPYNFNKLYEIESIVNQKYFNYAVDVKTKEPYPIKFMGNFCYHVSAMDFESVGSVNLLRTHTGKHITIFQRALGKALHKFNGLIKIPDAKYGLRSFTLSFAVEPFFEGQTKNKLGKYLDKGYNENHCIDVLADAIFKQVIEPNQDYFSGLCNKIIEYKRSLDRLTKKDFILSHIEYSNSADVTKGLGIGARVFDCTNKNPDNRILYITEGKSAGGTIVKARKGERIKDVAVLPLRGVPLNAATSTINKIVQNEEFKSIINTLGTVLDPFIKMDKRRYAKIILAPDADPAGQFIGALLLGFFGMYLKPWIDEGRVFLALSPLYRQSGKFIFDDSQLNKKKDFTRFKGLGEMSSSDIREALLDNPRLVQVTSEDIDKALKLIVNSANERKQLSRELGILTDKETFLEAVDESEAEILGNFDSAIAADQEDENDNQDTESYSQSSIDEEEAEVA